MAVAQPKANPRLYTHVLEVISNLKEIGGSHIGTIINHMQSAFSESTGRPRLRNVALQVRRAIQHGIERGMLKQTGGRVRLILGSKKSRGIRTSCGFICGKKKKKGKHGNENLTKVGHRKGHSKHGKGNLAKVGHRKGHSKHGHSGGRKSRHRSRSGAHSDPCAPRTKSKHRGSRRRKGAVSSGGGGKKRKRRHTSSHGDSSKGLGPKVSKRKKKISHTKKPKECSMQQSSHERTGEDNNCTCDTCHSAEEQQNSHVSFADEDEICGEQQQCNNQSMELIAKRRRSSRSPRRTSRQIRQGTPINLDRINTEFIPQKDNDEPPKSSNRSKEDSPVTYHENTDYINKHFDNNDIHGISQECDNPDCLCNIKQEPVDASEDHSLKADRNHCPECFSDRKSSDCDPDSNKDRNTNSDLNPGRDNRSSYFN